VRSAQAAVNPYRLARIETAPQGSNGLQEYYLRNNRSRVWRGI